jgi:hypothetical protein
MIGGALTLMVAVVAFANGADRSSAPADYLRAAYSPLHFKPAIAKATDAQCLACHQEVLSDRVREKSPAGASAVDMQARYQQVSTYGGAQETFHRRHLVTPLARELMDLRCTTCHQGQDVREEAQGSSATGPTPSDDGFTLRKQVNTETTCLKCHGQLPWRLMNLPGPWNEVRQMFGNSCYINCHENIRTVRHRVSYLRPDAIEAAGRRNADVCYGCHGGLAWYGIAYPYPRHAWPGMTATVPDWAIDRPAASEARFATATAAGCFKP